MTSLFLKSLTESIQSLTDIKKNLARNKDALKRLDVFTRDTLHLTMNAHNPNNFSQSKRDYSVTFKNITFSYKGLSSPLLSNFNAHIPFGSKVTLRGESGKGKTTLIKLLLGLYTPQEGHVLIGEDDSTMLSTGAITRIVSIVPQEPIVLEQRTIRENILLFLNGGLAPSDFDLCEALERVHLSGVDLDDVVINLSGGQKQRLALARALLNDTPILVLDEPLSAMDLALKSSMFDVIGSLEKTVILVSHDTEFSFPDEISVE
jgi:ABC-type bacteriocin/lantibiotic exporter with double-glycine peptidase domain